MRTSNRMVQGHVLLNLKSAFIFGCIAAYCATVQAEFPWKASTGDASDPYAYQNYLYIGSEQFPPSDLGGDLWKYSSKNACQLYGEDDNRCSEAIVNNPQELYGVTGASVDLAWETTTGRPDVVIAVTDSGIKWNDYGKMIDLARKTFLNRAELPLPQNRSGATVGSYDLNFDGVFNLTDYEEDPRVRDVNATGYLDPEDLIFLFSNGIDADNNGYVDDIAGWDFYEDDNDPYDEVQYGHGSGEAEDSTAEPNNGGGAGVAPNCMVMHMRVGDSFIADINDFAEAVTYATDNGASVVQCALGTLNNSRFAQEAINYAYRRGVVLMASAADESAGHHNLPAVLEHAVTVNSIGEPELGIEAPVVEIEIQAQPSYLEFRGCTNFGAYITAAVPSNSCSSEATGRSSGMAGLAFSAARNALARGSIADYGVMDGAGGVPMGRGISAEELDQLVATTADDINFIKPLLYTLRPFPETERYPATEGWDAFFGYGRINAERMVRAVNSNKIPPEADITSPRWFEILDPGAGPVVIEGTVGARRAAKYSYQVRWAVWSWNDANTAPFYTTDGVTLAASGDLSQPYSGVLANISSDAIVNALRLKNGLIGAVDGPGVDPVTGRGDHENRQLPDKFAVIVQLIVTAKNASGTPQTNIDGNNLEGFGTKCFHLHRDPALFEGYPLDLQGGMAAAPRFADLDNDGVDELVLATSNGEVHALKADGTEVPGWPVYTADAYMHYGAPAYQSGEISVPVYAAVLESPAVGDLDRDGSLEVVVGDFQGRISAFNRYGQMLPGFPARSNPAYSQAQRSDRESGFYAANPQFIPGDYPGGGALPNNPDLVPDLVNRKNKINSSTWWFLAAPSLGNIDPSDEALEIVGGAMDRHLYAFKMDGSAVPGWPVMLRDPAYVGSVDPLTHRVTNAPGVNNRRGAMIVTSVAIGDLTGDGVPEVVSGVNEQYDEPMNSDDTILPDVLAALGESGGNNRVYAVYADGSLHAGPAGSAHPHANAFLPGWPAKIASLTMELLPVVGEGPNGAPVMADVDGNGTPEVGIFGVLGPAYVLKGDGTSIYGRDDEGRDRTLLMQPFGPGANSVDTPSIPALGGGIFSQFQGEGIFSFACGAAGLGKFLDVILNDDQLLSDNHLSVWDLQGGRMLLPFFPREVNDLHFLCTPASADVDGDGLEEVLDATAYSDLHAFNALGEEPGLRILSPTGWPKFTAGWQFSSPSVGDFDGDGLRDIAVTTREAWLFVWRGNGATSCDPASWPEWGHDGWNSNNAHVDAVRPDRIADLSATQSTIPALARVEGGGNIPVGSGKGNFGIEAKLTEETLEGHLIFHDKAGSGIKVKSNNITSVSIQADAALEWTAPGDGPCGAPADHYEIRYAHAPIAESTWAQANVLENNLTPQPKGSRESLALPNLPAGVYYFCIQAVDAAGNRGPISNAARTSIAREGESVIEGIAEIDSEDGHAFTVIVQDNGDPGKDLDWFEIALDTGYQAGGLLSSGNIKIYYTPLEVAAPPSTETKTTWQLLFGLDGLNFLLGLL